ncbi:MAG: hypothetical protein ACI81V_000804 [Lentimonas sp.]
MNPRTELLPREKLLRDTFTPAETFLFWLTLIVASIACWLADPRSGWALGCFLIAAPLCPIVLKIHESTHPFFIELLWPRFWLILTPVLLLLLQFVIGLLQSPLQTIEIENATYLSLTPVTLWQPTTTAGTLNWLTLGSFSALYLVVANLFLIPKSRYFFERMLKALCLGATAVAIFGYLQKALLLQQPLFTKGTGQTDFFAFFPYDGHWAAFALLWCSACGAMTLLGLRGNGNQHFLKTKDRRYYIGTLLLGASGFLLQARWPAAILLLVFAAILLKIALVFWQESQDRHRKKIALLSTSIAGLALYAGMLRILDRSAEVAAARPLNQAAFQMFQDNPVFGWGADSFDDLLPFYISDTLSHLRFERAGSDFMQLCAEFGLFGIGLLVLTFSVLIRRYLRGRTNIKLTNQLLFGCAGLIVLAGFDSPCMSPAVFISFWLLFFTALRWADLTRNRADEVDAAPRPTFVTPASKRNVPFYNNPS